MSGGVDSSVAALLLREAGHDVVGVFLRVGDPAGVVGAETSRDRSCCSAEDAMDARRVAGVLGIPIYAMDASADFRHLVQAFCDDYLGGRTPIPCVACNRDIKFGRLLAVARDLGAERVATGHYARVARLADGPALLRAADAAKDQTYFLASVDRDALGQALFPVGHLTKTQVRERARQAALPVPVIDKPESAGICFVPDGNYRHVLERLRPGAGLAGDIIDDEDGSVVGRHAGVHGYTVGQRRGLGVARGSPRYVTEVDPATATVHIGAEARLGCRSLVARGVNWLAQPGSPREVRCQVRHRQEGARAILSPLAGDAARVDFHEGVRAVARGQQAVFYEGERCLGGGVIAETGE
ncbi:MAG: tRNA 2-thiouridine(34) synthase MnmA [Planctomycetes bacterium]|nr:tRNA 2-thiouridine(34) synthase MnmA [Planctomycetota bacterium]